MESPYDNTYEKIIRASAGNGQHIDRFLEKMSKKRKRGRKQNHEIKTTEEKDRRAYYREYDKNRDRKEYFRIYDKTRRKKRIRKKLPKKT